ncbi:MAG TPA: archaemetzincin family Zn-dependent metalloprotease [Methanoregulaceae archaeon]|nr:archaemetzincin family Zn-dependent metalloprotease [Methanoregulaceae archaeon]HQJ88023.1 archaemetzincin family Zn-dependent metalloprotease [Methanoregulaceae archaeon]
MRFTLYWDHRSPPGLQLPVQRAIEGILGVDGALLGTDRLMLTGFDLVRRQYNAEVLLSRLDAVRRRRGGCNPLLLVIPDDIFVQREEFVYGLAHPGFGTAIVSTARLTNEFYGRRPCEDDLVDRIAKEGAHEIGHLLGLPHCPDRECVMFAPHSFDELDRKRKMVCPACTARLRIGA